MTINDYLKNSEPTFYEKMAACKSAQELFEFFQSQGIEVDEEEVQFIFQRSILKGYVKLGDYDFNELAEFLKSEK